MAVYYQHIGEKLSGMDFPEAWTWNWSAVIGLGEVEPFLRHLPAQELADIVGANRISDLAILLTAGV